MNKLLAGLLLAAALLAGAAALVWWPSGEPDTENNLAVDLTPDADLTGPDLFKEVAAVSGIHMTYRNGEDYLLPNGKKATHLSILESLGGGIALIDYDGDGLLDIFIPGGGYFGGPDHKDIRGYPCKLYKNLGNWHFKDVTKEVGLDRLAGNKQWFYSHAAAVADYDRDGWPDLLVTGWGRVALFHNVPDGKGGRRFVDVSADTGLDKGITWATSAAGADLDGDGWPDLYVCQYVNWSWKNNPKCHYYTKIEDVCPPRNFDGLPHKVFHNVANGRGGRRFVDVSAEAGLRKGGKDVSKGLAVLIVDVNLDGKPDIWVANDTVPKFLYVNHSTPGKIRLKELGAISGATLGGNGDSNGSMGMDAGDPAGQGMPWLWVTNYENELHGLYENLSTSKDVMFRFATEPSGIAAIGQKYVGWGTGFVDIDHHGWEDIFIVDGHAIRFPTGAPRRQKPVLLRNQGGTFLDMTKRGGPYFREAHLARGAAQGDLDNDGKIDLVVSHINDPVAVLRNVADEPNHWVGVDLVGKGFADIVGARVILEAGGRKQLRFAKGGGSYCSCPDRRLVFGVGKTGRIDKLSVIWPNGKHQVWKGLDVDSYHVLVQDEEKARRTRPRK